MVGFYASAVKNRCEPYSGNNNTIPVTPQVCAVVNEVNALPRTAADSNELEVFDIHAYLRTCAFFMIYSLYSAELRYEGLMWPLFLIRHLILEWYWVSTPKTNRIITNHISIIRMVKLNSLFFLQNQQDSNALKNTSSWKHYAKVIRF